MRDKMRLPVGVLMVVGGGGCSGYCRSDPSVRVLVRVQPGEFVKILAYGKDLLVVIAEAGIFSRKFQYLNQLQGPGIFHQQQGAD